MKVCSNQLYWLQALLQSLGGPIKRRSKLIVSLTVLALIAATAIIRKHHWEKDDEEGEEAFELAEKAQAQAAFGAGACGVERWAVKTMSDADARKIQAPAIDITVDELANAPVGSPWGAGGGPHQMPPDQRVMSGPYAENQIYRVRGNLVRYKMESDKDYHLVLEDPQTGKTIIVESADPSCPGANSSTHLKDLTNVRAQFQASFSAPTGQFTDAGRIPVTVKGVRFFDHLHGQNGVAQNGVELHPLLCISTGHDCDN